MSKENSYQQFATALKQAGVPLSPTELQGFLTGLICGGVADQSWQPLLYQFTNDGQAYPQTLLQEVNTLYQTTYALLADIDGFNFQLWLVESDSVFAQADSLSEWANHFLLGLGLAQPRLEQHQNQDIQEALQDLNDICRLTYDEDDDPEELNLALDEVSEYVRTLANLFFAEFRPRQSQAKPLLH
ncbi:hypothetical protein EV694_1072 [Volucribacter psittacicida]|uniref:UPF0149 protein EV694_1072 n=1 Tax=Volucribacter psittacicida TaxID=203482 RepID=A0A4R1G0Z9_9PAST|nr:YecA family protein [Volucribacter psittacicida]TCJ98658.1 hypothetical protein EV694_1072 [Volucribacter psittacicida]